MKRAVRALAVPVGILAVAAAALAADEPGDAPKGDSDKKTEPAAAAPKTEPAAAPSSTEPAAAPKAPAKKGEDAPLGAAGPETVDVPPRPQSPRDRDFAPFPDRWRIRFPEWQRNPTGRGETPYQEKGSLANPYNQNVLKGDYPIIGNDIFLVLGAQSDTIVEGRALPIPSGNSTDGPHREDFFGDFDQFLFVQNFSLTAEVFKGDTAFKPKDFAVKVTPVFNINYLRAFENNVVNIDVRKGHDRLDGHVALQEANVELHLFDLSPNYDFTSVTAGIQQFQSDFRGFLYSDNNMGIRWSGNYLSNRIQWNAAYFYQLDKNTNSGLNAYEFRDQNVFIANLFVQDFGSELSDSFFGYTLLASYHANVDLGRTKYDDNGFLVRPAKIGFASSALGNVRQKDVRVHYLGIGGDGHVGPLNLTHQYYLAVGQESFNEIAGRKQDVLAHFFASELSLDIDWIRVKGSFLYASGDPNPDNGQASGFDTIIDNPFFAGAGFSYWQRQQVPLVQTGVNLVQRFSILPDLRSSKFQGKSNFVNPGLLLYNVGTSAKITPRLFLDFNVNFLFVDRSEVLEKVLVQNNIGKFLGVDYSVGVQYRPLLTDNVIITAGAAAFQPGGAFKNIYTSQTLYSAFGAITFTY